MPTPQILRRFSWSAPTHTRSGFLLLEALLAISLFALFIGAVSIGLYLGQEGTLRSGDRVRAVYLSERALQATRSIRDMDFAALTAGSHGLCEVSGRWQFCGTESESDDHFFTRVTVTPLSADRISATAQTYWRFARTRSGSVLLSEDLTNWRAVKPIGNWGALRLKGAVVDDAPGPSYSAVAVADGYAYVTSGTSGPGLSIFDISTDTAPQRVASNFVLGFAGSGVVVGGHRLYVVTADPSAEVKIYDITSPSTFSAASLLGQINIPGSKRAMAASIFGNTLFVTATDDSEMAQFYVYDVSHPATPVLLGSLVDPGGTYGGLSLHEGFAYVAAGHDESELKVVDVFNAINRTSTGSVSITLRGGYNLSGTIDGISAANAGSTLLLGRTDTGFGNELVYFDLSLGPIPSGPLFAVMGAGVSGIATDPSGSYAFVSVRGSNGQLQVIDLTQVDLSQLPVLTFYSSTSGIGRSVAYDIERDRVVLVTERGVFLFGPG